MSNNVMLVKKEELLSLKNSVLKKILISNFINKERHSETL